MKDAKGGGGGWRALDFELKMGVGLMGGEICVFCTLQYVCFTLHYVLCDVHWIRATRRRCAMMHVQERRAWFMLWCMGVPLVLYAALVPFVGFMHGAEGVFGLAGIGGLAGLIGRKERREGKLVIDERDQAIMRQATAGAFGVFWVLFILAC